MASQTVWHPELSDSGIYDSSDNFSRSQVYIDTRSDVGEYWYRQFTSLKQKLCFILDKDLDDLAELIQFVKRYRESVFNNIELLGKEVDDWVKNILDGSRISKRMTHELGRRAGPAMDSNPVSQNDITIGNVSNVGIGPSGTIGSCERPSQPPPLESDPNVWRMKTADSNPVNRQYTSFRPNSSSSELNFTANNGNDSVHSISLSNIDSVASEETYTCTCTRCVAVTYTNNFRDSHTQTEPVSFSLPVYTSSQDACIQCDLLTVDFPPENKVVSAENEVNSVHEHRDTRDRVTSCKRGRSEKRTSTSSHCRNIRVSRSSSSGRSDSRDRRSRSKYRSSEHSVLHSYARANGHREEQNEKQCHISQSRTSSCSSEADSFSSTCRGEFSHVSSGRRCFSCDSPEHFIRDCPDKKTRTCFKCGSSNHLIKFCPKYKQQKVRFKN